MMKVVLMKMNKKVSDIGIIRNQITECLLYFQINHPAVTAPL
jgi:hypothetical protein